MNRRNFIKSASLAAAIPAIAITCKYEDDEKGKEALNIPHENSVNWDYRVYCYERQQGEWTFSENIRGSFAYQREYTLEEDNPSPYAGWMDGGKLHFVTLQEAQDFIDDHVRVKDDTNLIDSIYDIYYVDRYHERAAGEKDVHREKELQVAHYWFNGDTGRQVHWVSHPHDWSKVECA